MMTIHDIGPDAAFGGWLMPVVPPMVSAASGALLIPHLPPGQGRLTLLLACYAMFGISLFASVIIITQIWSRLVVHKPGPAIMVPTLWIVLGPLSQSVAADRRPGRRGPPVLPRPVLSGSPSLRPAVRGAGLGIRHAVARAGREYHCSYCSQGTALCSNLVEPSRSQSAPVSPA